MKVSSGLLLTSGDRWLLAQRSARVASPGVWSVPGGGVPLSADGRLLPVLPSACREFREELGADVPPMWLRGQLVRERGDHRFVTFVCEIEPWRVSGMKLAPNWETGDVGWFSVDRLPDPLHPAFSEGVRPLEVLGTFGRRRQRKDVPVALLDRCAEHDRAVDVLSCGWEGDGLVSVERQRALESALMRCQADLYSLLTGLSARCGRRFANEIAAHLRLGWWRLGSPTVRV